MKETVEKRINAVLEKIKIERTKKSLTQEKMAEEIGITVSGYGQWERGEIGLSLDRIFQISDVLQLPAHELFLTENLKRENIITVQIQICDTDLDNQLRKDLGEKIVQILNK